MVSLEPNETVRAIGVMSGRLAFERTAEGVDVVNKQRSLDAATKDRGCRCSAVELRLGKALTDASVVNAAR